jgi:2,4-dienoyl-CoA reductase (NADPH2)
VLAQGSTPWWPNDIPGIDQPHVIDYTDVLEKECPVAFPVVVIGGGGVACDVAKFLIKRSAAIRDGGHQYLRAQTSNRSMYAYLQADTPPSPKITLLQRSSRKFAHRVGRTTRWILMQALEADGVVMRNRTDIVEIASDSVAIFDRVQKREELLPAHSVVAAGQVPAGAPIPALETRRIPYSVLGAAAKGDGRAAAGVNLTSALRSAYQLAMDLV